MKNEIHPLHNMQFSYIYVATYIPRKMEFKYVVFTFDQIDQKWAIITTFISKNCPDNGTVWCFHILQVNQCK